MSRRIDGVMVPRWEDINFNWSDTGYVVQFQNKGNVPLLFERVEFINGTTAGTTTAAVLYVDTPNVQYQVSYPNTAMPAGQAVYQDAIGRDEIAPDAMIYVSVHTAPSAAKEAICRLKLSCPA